MPTGRTTALGVALELREVVGVSVGVREGVAIWRASLHSRRVGMFCQPPMAGLLQYKRTHAPPVISYISARMLYGRPATSCTPASAPLHATRTSSMNSSQ